jgi:thiol-disulfide isomerase/thioredoxin
MKKYLPILIFISFFTGFLITNVGPKISRKTKIKEMMIPSVSKKYEINFQSLVLNTIDEKSIEISSLNIPIVIFNFWASWCGPCLDEFSSLVNLRKKYSPQDLMIISISSDEEKSKNEIVRVIDEKKINFPVVHDFSGKIFNQFDILNIPTTIIFYKGKIWKMNSGEIDFNSIEFLENLDKLLNKNLALTGQK